MYEVRQSTTDTDKNSVERYSNQMGLRLYDNSTLIRIVLFSSCEEGISNNI